MIKMREGAWLPSQQRGMVYIDSDVAICMEAEVAAARTEAVAEFIMKMRSLAIMTEVGECVMLRELHL